MFRKYTFLQVSFLIAGLWLIQACKNHEDIAVSPNPEMTGLAAPIMLQPDSTVVELSDYLRHPKAIDSLMVNPALKFRFSEDSSQLTLIAKDRSLPRLSVMKVWANGYSYSLVIERSTKIWQHFTFDSKGTDYRRVELVGEMNNWIQGKNVLKVKDGKWQTDFLLYPGKYDYQLIIDGKIILDPSNPDVSEGMNGVWHSVFHAGTLNPQGTPILYTDKAEKDKITIGIKNKTTEILVFWQNVLLDSTFWKPDSTGISIRIPKKAKDFNRSFIRVWAYNQVGVSNQILIPVRDGKVLTDPGDLTREDKEAMIIYSLMVDRFMNGNTRNDAPVKDSLLDRHQNFQGGDLTGILQKIEDGYFTSLGVNTLWISPVNQNPSGAWNDFAPPHRKSSGYHGYWPVSLTTVDNRFGTSDELKSMVEEAHSKDINVIMGFVSNHLFKDGEHYKQHPEWFTPLLLENNKKNIRLWNEQPFSTWADEFLPTLDLTRPEVSSMMSDSTLYWIKAYEMDGLRHDAANRIPDSYWRILTRKLKENVTIPDNRPIYQVGQTSGTREQVQNNINPGKFDAQLDLNLYTDASNTFARDNTSFKDLYASLQETFNYYGDHSLMANISGNEDMARFISYASGAILAGEDDSKAGWDRKIEVKDTIGYQKLAALHAFNMTIPGIPVIYYGDEIGMAGANDPDNRRMMHFDSLSPQQTRLKATVEKLTHLRKNNLPLIY
ncbi:MAG TPA: alpha-amylase family glycosyl hydrolase, partial [Bacteroidales bacterium]|nr:alpha-amylase family glycosyl hydrolase [Bacteroidales bacterium]